MFDLMSVGMAKNLLNSKAGLSKFFMMTLTARWNGRSTNGRTGRWYSQKMFTAEKTAIRVNDILSVLVKVMINY